jgi:2-oxoglutarate ferredoxin oxidoreductase subunit delta
MSETKTKNFSVTIEIVEEWCKGCDVCVAFCPKDVLELKATKAVVKNLDACTACNICELLCPDFAIKVVKKKLADGGEEDEA